ncbi:DUF6221 family protein [Amycolatopsis thermoflava]|uniref:DUF6221 family protein n=1 Tax=Amycolatopsis thermoflava TaxID=84480 RepID=UPI0004232DF1|nr:DUF6221 family protein [Amycolatopsis thermoflava]
MSDTEALIAFLRACLDEDWNCAAAAGHGFGHLPLLTEHNGGWTRLDLDENVRPSYDVRYLKWFDPHRMMAEVESKRRILDLIEPPLRGVYVDEGEQVMAQQLLRVLAVAFRGRSGFQEEWAPHD